MCSSQFTFFCGVEWNEIEEFVIHEHAQRRRIEFKLRIELIHVDFMRWSNSLGLFNSDLFKITWINITKLLIWHMNPPVPLLYDALEHRDGFSEVFSLLFIISLQVSLIGSTAHRNHTQISSRSAIYFYFYADSHSLTLRLIFNRLMMISSLCEKIVELLIFLSWILFTRPLKPGGRRRASKVARKFKVYFCERRRSKREISM